MATALSIAATVIALVSLALTLRREWLDRAQLHVSVNPMTTPDGHGDIVALVENHGRQPALVKGIGLEWKLKPGVLPGESSGHILFNDPWARVRVGPVATTRCAGDRTAFIAMSTPQCVDSPSSDVIERYGQDLSTPSVCCSRWAGSLRRLPRRNGSMLRRLARQSMPVVPRWKLWKPKEQRAAVPAPEFDRSPEEIRDIRRRLIEAGEES